MRQLDYVARITRFALKENPLLYFSVLVSLFSVVIELLTLASLFPLLQLASTGMVAKEGMVVKGLGVMGVATNGQALHLVWYSPSDSNAGGAGASLN